MFGLVWFALTKILENIALRVSVFNNVLLSFVECLFFASHIVHVLLSCLVCYE